MVTSKFIYVYTDMPELFSELIPEVMPELIPRSPAMLSCLGGITQSESISCLVFFCDRAI